MTNPRTFFRGARILPAVLVVLYAGGQESRGAAHEAASVVSPRDSGSARVLTEDGFDVIALERTIYFLMPDGADATTHPGLYRVQVAAPGSLRLTPADGSDPLLVQALTVHHRKEVAEPVALSIRDGEDRHHVVLLLPDGQGLDAVAAYSAVRPRGWNAASVVLELIEKAFAEKPRPIRKDEKKGGH